MKKTVTTITEQRFDSDPEDEEVRVSVTLRKTVHEGFVNGSEVTFELGHIFRPDVKHMRELWSLLGRALDAVDGKVGSA